MKKTATWIVIIALVCVGGFFGYGIVRRRAAVRAAAQNRLPSMAQATVTRRDLEVAISGKGTVQANLKKNVQPGVSGTVSSIAVSEGDIVKKGSPIMYLTNDSVTYQADQARLDLALAEKALEELTGPAGGKAKAELDVRSAETSLEQAENRVASLDVVSPITGEVWDIAVGVGDSVKAGQTVATVADTSAFTIEIKIKQADVTRFRTGASVSVAPGGDLPLMGGILTSIGKEGTQGSKGIEFPATITVPNPARDLRAGMTVNVNYTDDDGNTYSLTGTVSALSRKEVKAEVDGTVVSIGAAEGSTVSKGQTLVALENNSLIVARDQAKTALESARQTLASFQNTIDAQALKVESARLAYKDKMEALSKLTVTSPIDGKVLSCSVRVGDEVAANETVASIGQVSPLIVTIPVDELDIVNVAVGQAAEVEIDALPGQTFTGRVQKIAQEGTVQQGITNYVVTVELESDAPRIGMSASATIQVAQKTQVLTIPVEAIRWDGGQASVNRLVNGRVEQVRIKIGVQGDLYAEVVSGLDEGDTVLPGNTSTGGFGNFRGFGVPVTGTPTTPMPR